MPLIDSNTARDCVLATVVGSFHFLHHIGVQHCRDKTLLTSNRENLNILSQDAEMISRSLAQ